MKYLPGDRIRIWITGWVERFSIRVLIGFFISVLCLVLFAMLAEDVIEQGHLQLFDQALATELHRANTAYQIQAYKFISLFGYQILFPACAVIALILAARRQWLNLLAWSVALAGGQVLNFLLKTLFARPRPVFADPVVIESYYSFPSGHAMFSLIAYGMLAYLIGLYVKNHYARILVVFLAVLAIVLIGISRMVLGVHYLSDVVGGFIAGGVWLATCIAAVELRRHTTLPPENPADMIQSE
ncbi:MAG: phosphatase PAP2 family protein [Anaerolineae bacterium]|nr:phosphatase PAP2 family protein [Anaerolineae bacterium]